MDVEPNLFFGQLETKWSWKNKRYGRICVAGTVM